MGIQEIEQAITNLSPRELARFRRWFEELDAQAWDEQIEADAKSGRLDKIAEKALSEYRAGKAKEFGVDARFHDEKKVSSGDSNLPNGMCF